ncbi:MAG TPA: nucleotidyltransferase family protein [Nitrospiraceae bacterium]|nr:nucleotidyltransferase family protein [Nitrospiraceae bacterium]
MEAIILAGGFGSRLRTLVPDVPKPLAPIRSRPFLEYLLDYLILEGFQQIIVAVGDRADSIIGHFKAQYRTLAIRYSRETSPLGTGGAIRCALKAARSENVFVLNGDTFAQIDYRRMLSQQQETATSMTMAVKYVEDVSRYGRVEICRGQVKSLEFDGSLGGGYINAGVYLLPRRILEHDDLPEIFSFERDFLAPRIQHVRPRAFVMSGYFIDIGVPRDYQRAQKELPEWK